MQIDQRGKKGSLSAAAERKNNADKSAGFFFFDQRGKKGLRRFKRKNPADQKKKISGLFLPRSA
jgi:hypothetical protein